MAGRLHGRLLLGVAGTANRYLVPALSVRYIRRLVPRPRLRKTTKLLPQIDNHDVVVDAQHNVLQLLTLGTAVAVTLAMTLATARLWRGCRTS